MYIQEMERRGGGGGGGGGVGGIRDDTPIEYLVSDIKMI